MTSGKLADPFFRSSDQRGVGNNRRLHFGSGTGSGAGTAPGARDSVEVLVKMILMTSGSRLLLSPLTKGAKASHEEMLFGFLKGCHGRFERRGG